MICDSCLDNNASTYDKDMMMHLCYECNLEDAIVIEVDEDEDMFA
jgi:hypothetical protein